MRCILRMALFSATLLGVAAGGCGSVAADAGAQGSRSPLQSAYQHYVAAVRTARADVAQSQFSKNAQGQGFVDGIVNYCLGQALSLTTEQPLMELLPLPDERLGFNNPDNLYYTSRISDQDSYTIKGNRGTATEFLIEGLSGLPGNGPTAGQVTSSVGDSDLTFASDGSFSITLSANRPPSGNWMPLMPGTDNLLVRFTYLDWTTAKRGSISIAKTGGAGTAVHMTPALAATMLNDAATSIPLQTAFYINEGQRLALLGANHTVGPIKAAGQQGTDVQQWNVTGNYRLTPDESLIIKEKDAPASVAAYSSIVLATPLLASLEFVHHQASLNHDQVKVDPDGYIYYVISAKNPGVPNWLDDEGQDQGTIFARWQGAASGLGPEYTPTVTLVKNSAVRAPYQPTRQA